MNSHVTHLCVIFYILYRGIVFMTIDEIMLKCQVVRFDVVLANNDRYAEVIFPNAESATMQQLLEECMGDPIKPFGVVPSAEDQALTSKYGGINGGILAGQMLYKKVFDGYTVVVMLWPWQRADKTTCKIFIAE